MAIFTLKKIRTDRNFSQEELAQESGISLKTVQRIENGKSKGSAYTIKQLAITLDVDPAQLRSTLPTERITHSSVERVGMNTVRTMNLSALLVALIPLTHLIVPILIYRKHKNNPVVIKEGRKIISIQILWTLFAIAMMVILPLLSFLFAKELLTGSVPLYVPAYFFAVFINLLVILRVAYILKTKEMSENRLPNFL